MTLTTPLIRGVVRVTITSAIPGYGWCPPKCKWFTWSDHAPFRDDLSSFASTWYDQLVYQIWSLYVQPLRRYETRYKILKMRWFRVARGSWRSLKIAPFDSVYEPPLAFHSIVFEIHRDIFFENRRFEPTPHLFGAPLEVTLSDFRRYFCREKTRIPGLSYSAVCVILHLAILV